MNSEEALLQKIEYLIERLSMPLPADELSNGWSEAGQKAMLNFFEDLRLKLLAHEDLPYFGIVRGLDYWGVSSGELLQKAAEVDYGLRHR